MSCQIAVFLTTDRTNCLIKAGCHSAGTLVNILLSADGAYSFYVVVLGTYKYRNNNVLDTNLYELSALLDVELVTTCAGVELYVTGCLVGRCNRTVLLSLGGVIVIILRYLKGGIGGNLNLSAGLLDRKNYDYVLSGII